MNLAGRTVVVTRPAGQAGHLQDLLEAQGARVQHLPMLVIEPLAADAPAVQAAEACFRHLADYRHVIFISTNAVEQGMRLFRQLGQAWPATPAVYAIGRATANALLAAGVPSQQAEGRMDSEALLALPGLQAVAEQQVLLVCGEGGRSQLAATLISRGARVDRAETYRRVCPAYDASTVRQALSPLPDAIVVNSGETLKNLAVYVQGDAVLQGIPLVVPSLRVAGQATAMGFSTCIVASNARDESIVQALQDWNG